MAVLREVEVALEMQEVVAPTPGQNPTSGGLATMRTRTMVDGDTLASIAFGEYRNANMSRALAIANGIDDPMRVRPGTTLLVPQRTEPWRRCRGGGMPELTSPRSRSTAWPRRALCPRIPRSGQCSQPPGLVVATYVDPDGDVLKELGGRLGASIRIRSELTTGQMSLSSRAR